MLGDLFYEATGKVTSQRVLDLEGPKVETSFMASGNMKNIAVIEIGTFWSIPRSDGTLYGEDKDIIYTKEDNEIAATANAKVIGKVVNKDLMRFVGSVFFNASYEGKLAFLNNIVGIFEANVEGGSKLSIKKWEWK